MRSTLLCLLASGLLGLQMPLAKLAYDNGADPISFAILRAAVLAIVGLSVARVRGRSLAIPRYIWPGMAVVVIGTTILSYGYLGAVARIPTSLAAMIFYVFPLLVLIMDAIWQRRMPGLGKIAMVLLAFLGLGVVFGPTFDQLDGIGITMAFVAAFGSAAFCLIVPSVTARYSTIVMIGWSHVFVVVLFLPMLWLTDVDWPVTSIGWRYLSAACLCYVVGLSLTFLALSRAGSTKAAMLFNFEPITIVFVSAVILGEVLTLNQYAGGFLVLVALVMASRASGAVPTNQVDPTAMHDTAADR